ncbi:MAG TPA: DUF3348 domain-containing protein [Paraburkholderia sp.]|nr:DUF3348 domain-containing protein [Paraburkholderia sp.]
MVQVPQRTAVSGPTLIRLLARLTQTDVPESRLSLSDRLSEWLGWTDAIGLSTALNGQPPAVAAGARAFGSAEENECVRVRSSLAQAITGDGVSGAAKRRGQVRARPEAAVTDAPPDYAVFRHRYLTLQQSMETSIGNLRGRLRGMLAIRTPEMTRLAVVDAVMERALSPRERTLLATIPALLGGHFERLRDAAQKRLAEVEAAADAEASGNPTSVAPGAWLDTFRKDMQSVLLAELEIRFQPVEGLLAALRTC